MIQISGVSKNFGSIPALSGVTANISDGSIYGLVGTNGAGKSTLLRILSGVYRPDKGYVQIEGEDPYENNDIKSTLFYISDDQYYFMNSTMDDMRTFYKTVYPDFSDEIYSRLINSFGLDGKRRINTFSKGMARQAFIIFGFAARTKYIFLDETFDGLDPVMRLAVKKLLASGVADYGMTAVAASHNLRELEDICDHVGLLHKGGIVQDVEMSSLDTTMHKIQCAFAQPPQKEWFDGAGLLTFERRGRLCTIVAKGDINVIMNAVKGREPQFVENIPISLEELFIAQMEGIGYEIKDVIL